MALWQRFEDGFSLARARTGEDSGTPSLARAQGLDGAKATPRARDCDI